jgi:ParB-like chromosome segregation protein Spo0J
MNNYGELDLKKIKPAPWRATYVLKPDLRLLTESMISYGWIQPITVRSSDNMIIDGNYRWQLVCDNKKVRQSCGTTVPVVFVEVDDADAMLMHIRLNLGRGRTLGERMSKCIRQIVRSGKYTEGEVRSMLKLQREEMDLMMDGSLLKKRNISDYNYSPAWVPVEVADGKKAPSSISIERPPNADR